MVNKSTILNRFVLHTLQRNITRLAVITRKTNIKLGISKGGNWKRADRANSMLFVKTFSSVLFQLLCHVFVESSSFSIYFLVLVVIEKFVRVDVSHCVSMNLNGSSGEKADSRK